MQWKRSKQSKMACQTRTFPQISYRKMGVMSFRGNPGPLTWLILFRRTGQEGPGSRSCSVLFDYEIYIYLFCLVLFQRVYTRSCQDSKNWGSGYYTSPFKIIYVTGQDRIQQTFLLNPFLSFPRRNCPTPFRFSAHIIPSCSRDVKHISEKTNKIIVSGV